MLGIRPGDFLFECVLLGRFLSRLTHLCPAGWGLACERPHEICWLSALTLQVCLASGQLCSVGSSSLIKPQEVILWIPDSIATLPICLPVSQSSRLSSSLLGISIHSHLMMLDVPASGLQCAGRASSCSLGTYGKLDCVRSSLLCVLVSRDTFEECSV